MESPGWNVLMRGMQPLLAYEAAWLAGVESVSQAALATRPIEREDLRSVERRGRQRLGTGASDPATRRDG
jgi:hypothetical protein